MQHRKSKATRDEEAASLLLQRLKDLVERVTATNAEMLSELQKSQVDALEEVNARQTQAFERNQQRSLDLFSQAQAENIGVFARVQAHPGTAIEFDPEPIREGAATHHFICAMPGGIRIEFATPFA